MNRLDREVLQILRESELKLTDAQDAVVGAEAIVNSNSRLEAIPNFSTRLVDKIREHRGLIMGNLGFIGGMAGAALAVVIFPDQHSSFYNMFISPQQGMSAVGIAAGISLGGFLTRS